jgi:hypothetical protein
MAKRKQRSQYLMAEPNWAGISLKQTEEERYTAFRDVQYWIHQEIANKEAYKEFRVWVVKHSGWDKKTQTSVLGNPDWRYLTIGNYAFFQNKVGWMPAQTRAWVDKKLPDLIATGDKEIAEKALKKVVVAIKPKVIRNQLTDFLNAFDEMLDNLVEGKKAGTVEGLLKQIIMIPSELADARAEISKVKDEYDELVRVRKIKGGRSDWDEQLVEGYSHINTPQLRKIMTYFDEGLQSIDTFTATKRTVRRKKPVDPRKIVARLRHLKADKDLNIASINPVDILGSTEVWTYDVKRRRLGLYMSENPGGLGVHGTSITGYDDKLSYEKTLRKPDEQLPLITKKTRKALHEVVGKIRGKQMKVKTRINPNMLILKVQ